MMIVCFVFCVSCVLLVGCLRLVVACCVLRCVVCVFLLVVWLVVCVLTVCCLVDDCLLFWVFVGVCCLLCVVLCLMCVVCSVICVMCCWLINDRWLLVVGCCVVDVCLLLG